MKAKAEKTFLHDQLGRVEKGTEFEATEAQLSGVRRFVTVYQTKVTRDEPVSGPGEPRPRRSSRKAKS